MLIDILFFDIKTVPVRTVVQRLVVEEKNAQKKRNVENIILRRESCQCVKSYLQGGRCK